MSRVTPLWNALCGLQDEDYPLTGDLMHTRWCYGLRWELCALLESLSCWGYRLRFRYR